MTTKVVVSGEVDLEELAVTLVNSLQFHEMVDFVIHLDSQMNRGTFSFKVIEELIENTQFDKEEYKKLKKLIKENTYES